MNAGMKKRNGHAGTILVTEDNPVSMQLIQSVLERAYYRVVPAANAEESVAAMEEWRPDLVLLDINLPDADGVDFVSRIHAATRDEIPVPIVFLTADTDRRTRHRALAGGATDFLTKPFDPVELTARVSIHVRSRHLQQELAAANKALERERDHVARIQRHLLPDSLPLVDGVRFAAVYVPCRKAGGDYYDAFLRRDGRVLLTVADVSGHGLPAAIHMSIARALVRAEGNFSRPLPLAFHHLEQVLAQGFLEGEFMTCILGVFDPKDGTFEYVNAGHCPPIVLECESGKLSELRGTGPLPIGIDADSTVVTLRERIPPNSRLLLYTDGLVEQQDADGRPFAIEGVASALRDGAQEDIATAAARLQRALRKHSGDCPMRDDMTFLLVEYTPAATD